MKRHQLTSDTPEPRPQTRAELIRIIGDTFADEGNDWDARLQAEFCAEVGVVVPWQTATDNELQKILGYLEKYKMVLLEDERIERHETAEAAKDSADDTAATVEPDWTVGNCQKCGKAIVFLRALKADGTVGKNNPIEFEPHLKGNLVISLEKGLYRIATKEEIELARTTGKNLYASHFAYCEFAKSFSTKGKQAHK